MNSPGQPNPRLRAIFDELAREERAACAKELRARPGSRSFANWAAEWFQTRFETVEARLSPFLGETAASEFARGYCHRARERALELVARHGLDVFELEHGPK